jgi:hypothetical protein
MIFRFTGAPNDNKELAKVFENSSNGGRQRATITTLGGHRYTGNDKGCGRLGLDAMKKRCSYPCVYSLICVGSPWRDHKGICLPMCVPTDKYWL